MKFYKYHGTGNDFILINGFHDMKPLDQKSIALLCHRRFGIGADGLMILTKGAHGNHFFMDYYNADGNRSSMCGNGGRCIVQFAKDLGIIEDHASFLASDGPHKAIIKDDEVHLGMSDVDEIVALPDGGYELNTGSPHYIKFVDDVTLLESIVAFGKEIRYNDTYRNQGINVNLVHIDQQNKLTVATYERGVEDETYSCGTGVTAAALAYAFSRQLEACNIQVNTKGGVLQVHATQIAEGHFKEIVLVGPAKFVFEGQINVDYVF